MPTLQFSSKSVHPVNLPREAPMPPTRHVEQHFTASDTVRDIVKWVG